MKMRPKTLLNHREIIASVERLLAEGRRDDAQELLLDEGYVRRSDPAIQKAYLRLIPESSTLRAMLAEVYAHLDDANPKVRFDAATKLGRECAKVYPRDSVRWMRDPRASEPLIRAVQDPDEKVSERALRALACLLCSYFPDQRALPALLSKLNDRKQQVRISAISAIGCLRREEILEHFVDLLDHGTERDRAAVTATISGLAYETWANLNQRPIEWTETGKSFWTDRMISALRDPYADVRKQAAIALKQFGDPKALPALQAARQSESDANLAFYMDDTIAALKELP